MEGLSCLHDVNRGAETTPIASTSPLKQTGPGGNPGPRPVVRSVLSHGAVLVVGLVVMASATTVACEREQEITPPCDPPTNAVVAPTADTLRVGESAAFRGIVQACTQRSRALRWSLSNDSVASIASATDTSATVIGRGVGQTVLVGTAVIDTTVKAAALVTVLAVPPNGGP